MSLNFADLLRPRLTLEDDLASYPFSTLAIENPRPSSGIALATRSGATMVDRLSVDFDGAVRVPGTVELASSPAVPLRFHGTAESGLPEADRRLAALSNQLARLCATGRKA